MPSKLFRRESGLLSPAASVWQKTLIWSISAQATRNIPGRPAISSNRTHDATFP